MNLDFSNNLFKEKVLSIKSVNYENNNSSEDAFLIILDGLEFEMIENLCNELAIKLSINSYEVYKLIQSKKIPKKLLLETAYELIHNNIYLGNKIDDKKLNCSAWLSHCLYEGEVASNLASIMNLNPDTACKLGILHDVGRKFTHSFIHTIKGYEYLVNLGYNDEAIACLTHSFLPVFNNENIKGNRCANCDPALEGFYVNDDGEGVFQEENQKDDIAKFLDNYQYNNYDIILNISDLMATSTSIISPYERMIDVYSRRIIDPTNSPFFKVCYINTLFKILYLITLDNKYMKNYNIKNVDNIDELLQEISNTFMNIYNSLIISKKRFSL